MLPGMNHNIMHQGKMYHIQTEDGGRKHPFIESHLFLDGVILATDRISYEEHLDLPDKDLNNLVMQMMSKSHRTMINKLITGGYDETLKKSNIPTKGNDEEPAENPSIEMAEVGNEHIRSIAKAAEDESVEAIKDVDNKQGKKELEQKQIKEAQQSNDEDKRIEDTDSFNLYVIFGKQPPKQTTAMNVSMREMVLSYLSNKD